MSVGDLEPSKTSGEDENVTATNLSTCTLNIKVDN